MHLKRLTLKGFKSFADTTTLELEPGITVVVGPNGSGKSNLVDALAWVLGAQGAKGLRSGKMEDVIFAGTSRRSALGRAEVTLTLDNASGLLPVAAAEVTLRRTLFRNGDSEYAVNGTACRLLDVQELLSDSGVGRSQHVLVGQGQLDAVLAARPEDRRAVVEEAAGVLKYRRRKERAERRLAATEADLLRLDDLLREVRRALRPLERAAALARQHGEVAAEAQALDLHLAGRELAGLVARLTAAAGVRSGASAEEAGARAALAALDGDVATAEAALRATGASGLDVEALGDDLVRLERLVASARALGRVVGERRRGAERELVTAMDVGVVATLEAEAARLREELAEAEAEAAGLAPEADRLAAADAALAEERAAAPRWGDGVDPAPAALAAARAELVGLRTAVVRGAHELARVRASVEVRTQQAAALAAEAGRVAAELAALDDGLEARASAARVAEVRREAAEADLATAEGTRRAAEVDRSALVARGEALASALDDVRARAGVERLAGVPGVLGTLLELVEVDPGWEAAVEAALGDALAAVVVEGEAGARAALESLGGAGGVEGGPAGAVLPLGLERDVAGVPVAGAPVRAHVRSSVLGVAPLLDALLAGAGCVDGWEAALTAAARRPAATVVTPAGDRFARDGWRVGTGAAAATRVAVEEARGQAAEAEVALAAAAAEVERATAAVTASRAEEVAGVRRRAEDLSRRPSLSDALERARCDGAAAGEEAASLGAAEADLTAHLEVEGDRAAALEAALPAMEAAVTSVVERDRVVEAVRARLQDRATAVGALRADLGARATALEQQLAYLRRRLGEVEVRLEGDRTARATAEARRVDLERRGLVLDRLAGVVEGRIRWAEGALAEVAECRRRSSAEARAASAALDELRRSRSAAERSLDAVRERARRAELEAGEARLRVEAVEERIRRELDAEPAEVLDVPCPALPEGATADGRRRELERDLRLLGPVNPLAGEELAALSERHGFLVDQHHDVTASRRELRKVVAAVDEEIASVFAAAFSDVAANFAVLFGQLFPGGSGALKLTDPGDLLGTGIEVDARPSGKNVRTLSLLSGGERALAALAFLFAVFRSRPSPFYLLDEVEAALDDVNLSRFLDLLQEFGRESQLLVVSHQKRTMEVADCLYGVTLQPGGASRVVSERLAQTGVATSLS